MKIYIMRHGQTEKNQAKLLQGRSDVPLNQNGIREARDAGRWFSENGIHFWQVYASPLIRAVETAGLASGCTEVQKDDRLLEMDYGPYEGMDLTNPLPEIITFFSDFINNSAPDGMEQLSSVTERMGSFLNSIAASAATDGSGTSEKNILIVTHAVAMKGALEYLTPGSNGSYWAKYIGTCGVYAAEYDGTSFSVPVEVYSQGEVKPGI